MTTGGYWPSLTISQAKRTIDLYLAGKPAGVIAGLVGCNRMTVYKVINFERPYDTLQEMFPAGTATQLQRVKQERLAACQGNADRARWIKRMLDSGYTAVRAAEIAGVSYLTAYRIREGLSYTWLD